MKTRLPVHWGYCVAVLKSKCMILYVFTSASEEVVAGGWIDCTDRWLVISIAILI